MIVFFETINDKKALVTSVVNATLDQIEQTAEKCIEVNNFPQLVNQVGKDAVLYLNLEDKNLFYEYKDRPLTTEEKYEKEIESLKSENLQLGQQISDVEILLLQRNKDVESLGKTVTDLEIELLKLQTGGTK
ncbi:hypothetical protein LKM01_17715 [Bacillus pacificus]|uniref:hypothetical protein n=1 Tax=Bacillus pacificus TaxID=2026187 RepID=UPI001E53FD9E|nr:hypothetical protein [Bacillus pacificus]MCC2483663.1 hypothetical protein [Bacillus pacificus]